MHPNLLLVKSASSIKMAHWQSELDLHVIIVR